MSLADLPDYLPESLRRQARPLSLKRRQGLFRLNDPVAAIYYEFRLPADVSGTARPERQPRLS